MFCLPSSVFASSSSIGVSPSQISNNLLIPGAELDTVLTVSRASATESVTAKIEVFGDSISSWVTFPQGNTMVMGVGAQRIEMPVRISVPKDAKLGKYTGNLRFTLAKETAGQINIVPGVRVDIDLELTSAEVESMRIQYIKAFESAVGEKYSFVVKINNTGNVKTKPDQLLLTLFDISKQQLRSLTYNFTEEIDPFTSKEINVLVSDPEPLPIGEYFATVTVMKKQKEIFTDTLSYKVVKSVVTPTPEKTEKSGDLFTGNYGLVIVIGVIILLLILIGLLGLLFVFKRNEKKDTTNS